MLIVLGGTSACEARTSVEGAQTAVAVAQTTLPGLQTVLPNVQATAQVGATLVSGVLADPQAINIQVKALLAGCTVDIATTPASGPNETVTHVDVHAIDTQGAFGQIDARGRQAALVAALLLLGQYYPNASVAIHVVNATGVSLIDGSKQPGEQPLLANGSQ
ncbi:MAG: hypothetical protein NVSMB2_06450 [Chloroflexota bacterium]